VSKNRDAKNIRKIENDAEERKLSKIEVLAARER
jgi:hypothetical protein